MTNDFLRDPQGYRFSFGGLRTQGRPDTLPPGKYPVAINVRGYSDGTIQTRPGVVQLFQSTAAAAPLYPFLDLRAYSTLGSSLSRVLAVDANSRVWLDNSTQVGTLAGGTAPTGSAMIPFRPGASPSPWLYVANGMDYQKFSAPAPITSAVTQQKVGIAEPQAPPDAAVMASMTNQAFLGDPNTNGGTAGLPNVINRIADTLVAVLPVDAPGVGSGYYSLQVHNNIPYQRFQFITDTTAAQGMRVYDVFQPMATQIAVQGIFYYGAGGTGKCVVVPASLAAGVNNEEASLYGQNLLSALRRGALVSIQGEICLVQSVTTGPDGSVSFETSTTLPHVLPFNMQAVPAIMVAAPGFTPAPGDAITASSREYQVTVGIGTMTVTTAGGFIANLASFQPDDYIHMSILVDNLANLNEMKILLDVGDGSFTENFYYYTVRPSDIVGAVGNTLTQIAASQIVTQRAVIDEEEAAAANNQGVTSSSAQSSPGGSQWSEILFPISALTRVGDDQTRSLQTVNGLQFLWNASGTINVEHGTQDTWVIGGGQVDVGDVGAPLRYRVRPRSSVTGVVGNPSPSTRYGVNPRRGTVNVILPSAAYDAQIDTWDVFRYGGAVTSWRFIGTTPSSNTVFTDTFDDAAAQAGDALDFDNFEPWPSVDVPNLGFTGLLNSGQIGICGTIGVLNNSDVNIGSYLPGTLIQLAGGNVYTLWTRPVNVGGEFIVQFVENAGVFPSGTPYIIQEPFIANQHFPYMWGPDANGTVFACGDQLRPGTLSFAKNFAPDNVPDSYNQEVSPPSEPLLGGETIDGLAFVASSERWWALYPQQNASQRYNVVQQPFTRGLAAPYGHCNDGAALYWWAKDGIYSSTKGSLTADDLFNIFPHEGIAGENYVYGGQTTYAPDYTRAAAFRLTHSLGYLYAIYQDTTGTYRCLTYDLRHSAWCVDQYSSPLTAAYHLEQSPQPNDAVTLFGLTHASGGSSDFAIVAQQQSLIDDFGLTAVSAALATNEFDGGDARAPKQWGDFFLDCLPAASTTGGIVATPMSLGAPVAPTTLVPISSARVRVPIGVGGIVISDFMGLLLQWADDYHGQSTPTRVFLWQPSFVVQPARTISWATFGTSYGMDGYFHVRQLSIAYVSTADIVVTCTTRDGLDPAPFTMPSSAGQLVKVVFPLSANKGLLYTWMATSSAPFQIFEADTDVYLGAWGRSGPYVTPENFGGTDGASPI